MRILPFILTLLLLSTASCIDTFDPSIRTNVNTPLVVEGLVTTENGPYTVRLSRARPTQSPGNQFPVTDAIVSIEDDRGNNYQLLHSNSGIYLTDLNDFIGELGRSYRVNINVNGEVYISDFENIMASLPITGTSASFSFEEVQSETGSVITESFVTIFADLNFPTEDYYYRFDWEASYEARTPLQGSNVCWADDRDAPNYLDPLRRCYISEQSSNFLRLFSNERIAGSNISNYEIFKIDPTKRFQFRFSPLIKQYSLTKRAYNYWKNIEDLTSNSGSLFDVPPATIQGNIKNINSDEVVLGYFGASDVSTIRSFFSSSIIETSLDHYGRDCNLDAGQGGLGTQIFPPVSCCECTFLPNSTDQKPEYWID